MLDRRGISTVVIASLFFLILTFSTLALLLSGFFGYNLAINEEMRIEQERAQEKIILTELGLTTDALYITYVRVNNTGTIQVKIKAIYETNSTMTVFLGDPSTYMDTYIEPSQDLVIWGPNYGYITRFQPAAKLTLVTERGTKTTDFEGLVIYGPPKPPGPYDTSRYYIGPLELMFTSFYYRRITQDGTFDPTDLIWHPGWSILKSYGYVAWNITIRNIENKTKDLTINTYSSFTAVPNESPPSDERTWYFEPPAGQKNQSLIPGRIESVVYKWDRPKYDTGAKVQQIYSVSCRCLVFLTFYGWFNWLNGTTTTYAQTIPFEAAITVL